mmetsp:Transcript_13527/g.33121  ORF Transcript_13527/g.33121 Transcript_13527/m.33121 type:complete len:85 (+) Transcript_13527:308-562(+)
MSSKLVRKQMRELLGGGSAKTARKAKPAFPELRSTRGVETPEERAERRVQSLLKTKVIAKKKQAAKKGPSNAQKVLEMRSGKKS